MSNAITVDRKNKIITIDYSKNLTKEEQAYKDDLIACGYDVEMKKTRKRKANSGGAIKSKKYYLDNLSEVNLKKFEAFAKDNKAWARISQYGNELLKEQESK